MKDVSLLLSEIEAGKAQSAHELLPLVYEELRKLASAKLANERAGLTLQATALVHEAYLKLVGADGRSFSNRQHFFAAAAEAMRRILIDQARHKQSVRHGGELRRLPEMPDFTDHRSTELPLEANELIDRLATSHPRQSEVLKMRLFLQMTFVEIGEVLGISPDTAEGDWAYARAWLKRAYESF